MTVDDPGFIDAVDDAQICFRAVLEAMAHPGMLKAAGTGLKPPAPLSMATGAVLLTLADPDTPLWLGPDLDPVLSWLRFHCGCPFTTATEAALGVCLDLPDLEMFDWGTYDSPEKSATVIVQTHSFNAGPSFRLEGPGLKEAVTTRLGLPGDFVARWQDNHAAFPCGVDLIVCSGDQLAALPRTSSVESV